MNAVRACGIAACLLVTVPTVAAAQPIQGQLYAMAGALTDGEDDWIKYFSGGGDRLFPGGLLLSGDVGVAFARVHTGNPFDPDGERFSLPIASMAVGVQRSTRESRVEPFVGGGVSLVSAGLGFNVG